MAIIDPDGLFGGDRLRKCSDAARLWWPYLFLAANGFGRLEVNYALLVNRIAVEFKNPPTEEGLYGFLAEYRDNHLAFLYEAAGRIWAQFFCKPGSLPRWKTMKDRASPEPPAEQYEAWLKSYQPESRPLPKTLVNLTKPCESLPKISAGLGVGVGVGIGEVKAGEAPSKPSRSLPAYMTDEVYVELLAVGKSWGAAIVEEEAIAAHVRWRRMSSEQKLQGLTTLRERVDAGDDPAYFSLVKFCDHTTGQWHKPVVRPRGRGNGKKPTETPEERTKRLEEEMVEEGRISADQLETMRKES